MTYPTYDFDLNQLWNQSDATSERKLAKVLLSMLDEVGQDESPVYKKVKTGPSLSGPVIYWMEEPDYATSLTATLSTATLTISGNLQGAAVNEDSLMRALRVGTILQRVSDGMQCRVSSISGITDHSAAWTCTVAAHGNNVLSDDNSGATTYEILGETWTDLTEVSDTRMLDRDFRKCGTQIYAESFAMPHTRENTKYEVVGNEVEHQLGGLTRKLSRQEAYALLRGEPYYTNGAYAWANANQYSTTVGISTWPKIVQAEAANTDVYVNMASAYVYKSHVDDLIRNMWLTENANFNSGNWWILCHPLLHAQISEWDCILRQTDRKDETVGYAVNEFASKIGKNFPILADRYMLPSEILVVDFSKLSRGYYANDKLWRKEIPTAGRFRQWLLTFQSYGVVARKPRQIGKIYGCATS